MKQFSSLLIVALLSSGITIGAYKWVEKDSTTLSENSALAVAPTLKTSNGAFGNSAAPVDFTEAAEKAIHSVVHVKNTSYRVVSNPIMEFMYGYRGNQRQEQVGTGSGVIITQDGYIVTNNHVIQGAENLEVTLNNGKSHKATLVGTDEKMDIALLKIDSEEKLPYSTFSDSDQIKVGEWVLAVGNPYNLNSTVTAGIVSAKARNLGSNTIQSFIQTDAAVNPGNSGGALVNSRGELVGINTMISSTTGSYVGYSFAVPSNVTRKIVEDILEYGNVQRAAMGIEGAELNSSIAKELNVNFSQGFYINKVNKGTGAEKAGLKKGDIITHLDDRQIRNFADLTGYIQTKRPNEKVNVTFMREGKKEIRSVTLSKNEMIRIEFKGLELGQLDANEKKALKLDYGVKIEDVSSERLSEYRDELTGSILLKVGNVKITDMEVASKILSQIPEQQSVRVELLTKNKEIVRVIL